MCGMEGSTLVGWWIIRWQCVPDGVNSVGPWRLSDHLNLSRGDEERIIKKTTVSYSLICIMTTYVHIFYNSCYIRTFYCTILCHS